MESIKTTEKNSHSSILHNNFMGAVVDIQTYFPSQLVRPNPNNTGIKRIKSKLNTDIYENVNPKN